MNLAKSKKEKFDALLSSLPARSGVYRMIDKDANVLYVGKSRNLKARVASYFRPTGLATKTMRLVARTHDIQVTVTNSETEALLLEQTFIKTSRPPFNVLLRDDKSYPYIRFSNHDFPKIELHRGSKDVGGELFGPYPSAAAVRKSISILQRLFQLRPCKDSYFKNRSRPCLQHQIERCSAPCVGLIEPDKYQEDLRLASLFLKGKSQAILSELKTSMNTASSDLDFETAARIRDQIQNLRKVQEEQSVHTSTGDVDAFGVASNENNVCVHGMFIRDGRLLGHRNWFHNNELETNDSELIAQFLGQYYFGGVEREIPRTVLTLVDIDDRDTLATALSEKAGRLVEVTTQVRSTRARWQSMVQENAELSLASHVRSQENNLDRMLELQRSLNLEEVPSRLECFDISHSSGEATMASCVVFEADGPLKSDYRRYRIQDVESGDDYASLSQAVERRYQRIQAGEGKLPDVLIIDGGRGQINKVQAALSDLMVEGVRVLGISKGPGRRPGLETIWDCESGALDIEPTSGAMHLLQHIRDEAHRFAVEGHRARRQKTRRRSELDDVPGIGAKRKRSLLTHFGSVTAMKSASIDEMAKVPGISKRLASQLHGALHSG